MNTNTNVKADRKGLRKDLKMNNRGFFKRACLLAAIAALVAIPGESAAPQKQRNKFRGLGGSATSFWSDNNCVFSSINIFASESVSKFSPGGAFESTDVSVSVQSFNQCTGANTSVYATGQPVISGNLQTGIRITGLVTGTQFDYVTFASTPVSGAVDMVLTPTEKPILTHSQSSFGSPTVFQRIHTVGLHAEAAATGTVVVAGIDYLAAAIASGAGIFSSVQSNNSGSMEIQK